jgi:hypothetical protein
VTAFARGGFERLFGFERSPAARRAATLVIEVRTVGVSSVAFILAGRFAKRAVRFFAGAVPRIVTIRR